MDRAWANSANKLQFHEPTAFLTALRTLEPKVLRSQLPENVRTLRTNNLKEWRELREAALFCHGMGQRIRQTVYLARGESQDYDFVASWIIDKVRHLAPVQLKEVV